MLAFCLMFTLHMQTVLEQLMEQCERRISAEKLAAQNEVTRAESAAELNEQHALKVLEMQLVR